MSKIKIKASAINNLTEGRYFAALGVEWLGFPTSKLPPEQIVEIKEWLFGPRFVLELGEETEEQINEIVQISGVHIIETTRELNLLALSADVQSVIRRIEVADGSDLSNVREKMDKIANATAQFLLHFQAPYNQCEHWLADESSLQKLNKLCQEFPVIIEIDSQVENIESFLSQVDPFGLSIQGTDEEEVGLKNFDHIADLMDLLLPQ